MAGNKSIYDTAMKRAHEYAWANQWERAMKEYGRALSEFPNDRTAQRNMAQCMFRMKQWPQALAAYEKLLAADPTDAFALNRLAEIYLALGQQSNAAIAYTRLADLYIQNNQIYEAIRALRDLSRAMPKNKEAHERLLDLNQQVGDGPAQAIEHLALSQLALDASSLGEAQQHADAAAALDANNPDIRRWVYTVRRRLAEAAGTVQLSPEAAELAAPKGSRPASALGTQLLFQAEPEPPEATALAKQAADASARGEYTLAMDLYDQAVRAGAKHPSVFYSAGVLFHQMRRSDTAIAYLERALQDPEFAMSANYVLGECHMELRNTSRAVAAFERALALVEFDKLSRNEADELIELFKAAAEAHLADDNPGRAASLFSNLAGMFKQRKWSHAQLGDIERKADDLYNRSIQHKLEGISRGSAALDPSKVPDTNTQAMPPMDGGTAFTATTVLPLDGTPAMPEPASAASPRSETPEMATAFIAKPGSSLRSITEYLRAAEAAQSSPPGGDGTQMLPRAAGTEILPLPNSALDDEFAAELADLPDTILDEKTEQDLSTQLLIAEGEHAMAEGQWHAAIDSCWMVISKQPSYLPMHMMLGDIFLHLGHPADAAVKYQVVMDTYMVRGNADKAAEICERLLLLQPDNPALQTRLGVLLMEAGRVDDAARALLAVADRYYQAGDPARALEEALILKESLSNSSDVALFVGTYQATLGQSAEAIVELSRALQLNPSNDVALIRLYICLAQLDDPAQWDALQSVLERSAKGSPNTRAFMEELHKAMKRVDSPALYYALAVMASRAGLEDISADALDQGILSISLGDGEKKTESWLLVEALMTQMRADMAINAKEWGLAVRHYTRTLEIAQGTGDEGLTQNSKLKSQNSKYDFTRLADPVQLNYGLAEAQASQSNWDGALQALKTLKTLIPEDQGVNTRLADIHFRQGHLTDALGELNDVLVTHQKANDTERTLETLGHMAKLAPNNIAVRRKLSELYLKLGMTDQGVSELNTLAELQLKAGLLKDAMRTYGKAANLHYTLGQHDKAIGIYERVVRIAPRDLDARDQLVNMYIQAGKIKEAVASERALADLFIEEGRTEEAIATLHQLLALAPEDTHGHYALAKQLTAMGEYGQAARLYGRLLRLDPENDRLPSLQSEMQRLAEEKVAEAEKAPVGAEKQKG